LIVCGMSSGLAVAWVLGNTMSQTFTEVYRQDAETAAVYIQEEARLDLSPAQLVSVVEHTAALNPHIDAVVLYRVTATTSSVVAAAGRRPTAGGLSPAERASANRSAALFDDGGSTGGKLLDYVAPLRFSDGGRGAIEVFLSRAKLDAASAGAVATVVVATVVAVLLGIFSMGTILNQAIVRRLRPMADVARRLERGLVDIAPLQLREPGRDEMSQVARGLDRVVESVRRRRELGNRVSSFALDAAAATEVQPLLAAAAATLAMPVAGASAGAAYYNETTQTSWIESAGPAPIDRSLIALLSADASGQAIVAIEDLALDGRSALVPLLEAGMSCLQAAPVRTTQGIIGTVVVCATEPRLLSETMPEYLESVAAILAAAAQRFDLQVAFDDSRRRLSATFDRSPAGLLHLDAGTGQILLANPSFCRMVGYDAAELKAMTLQALGHPDDPAEIQPALLSSVVVGGSAQATHRYRTRSGRTLWAEVSSSVINDRDGRPDYILTAVLDVTEQKAAEQAMSDTLALLRRTNEDRQRLLAGLVQAQHPRPIGAPADTLPRAG